MDVRTNSRLYVIAGIVLAMTLGGCVRTPAVKYYDLNASQSAVPASRTVEGRGESILGVGPVQIPEYLDRLQIVTRSGPNSLKISDFHRWAEPLSNSIKRVVAQNLSSLLPRATVVGFPWRKTIPVEYKIPVEVLSFEGDNDQTVNLLARWQIYDATARKMVVMRESRIHVETNGRSYRALAAAQSEILAKLSQEIASAIQALTAP